MKAQILFISGEWKRINVEKQLGGIEFSTGNSALAIECYINGGWTPVIHNQLINAPILATRIKSESGGESKLTVKYYHPNGQLEKEHISDLFVFKLQLQTDSTRNGQLDYQDNAADVWVWGQEQRGAIVMVNNDKDINDAHPTLGGFSEWAPFHLLDMGFNQLPFGITAKLFTTESAARRFSIYKENASGQFEVILGRSNKNLLVTSPDLSSRGETLFIEAHEYPSSDFEGLITIEAGLVQNKVVTLSTSAVFRVAPWIMTPNTLPPKQVYTCRVGPTEHNPNQLFLKELKQALDTISVPLTIIEPQDNLGDRWIQDEIEFGYQQSPTHVLPVVMDSPRDRGLDDFPEKALLGEDFGHFQIGGSDANSLDSFGNLEVSPPVTVNGTNYPFGRIVFGGKKYGEYNDGDRQMMPQLRKFLYGQKVQHPFEINTDWLAVGHVDEIICFIPAPNEIGFVVGVASIDKARDILNDLEHRGYGSEIMFQGRMRGTPASGDSAEISISSLLANNQFWQFNDNCQAHMDGNVLTLKKELGIDDSHIVNIPVLFHPSDGRTLAYFPDMVNHLVLGNTSIVPKPYGPVINGVCAFEKAFSESLYWRDIHFIQDWYAYHEMSGEVHCGTNTLREPFPSKTWWSYKPVGGYDI